MDYDEGMEYKKFNCLSIFNKGYIEEYNKNFNKENK